MPIRPENRARYPKEWPSISVAIKERAGWRCEGSPDFPDCRRPHGSIGYVRDDGSWRELLLLPRDATGEEIRERWAHAQFEFGDTVKVIRIVLTVGHLDHTPENCDQANLRAWCQRCHLHYDRHHHAATASATRRRGKAVGDLFSTGEP